MKKIKLLLCLFVIFMFCFCNEIKAKNGDVQIMDTNKLIAKCAYNLTHKTSGTGASGTKFYIYIHKDYSLTAYSPDVEYGKTTGSMVKVVSTSFMPSFSYTNYVKNNKVSWFYRI